MKLYFIVFLFFNNLIFSQNSISRFKVEDSVNNMEIVRRYKSSVLILESPLEDKSSINVGIVSDSLDTNLITVLLYVYYPPAINPKSSIITIFYDDHSKNVLNPRNYNDVENYMEYDFVGKLFIHRKKLVKISFSEIKTYYIEDSEFFIDFFKQLIKNGKN